MIYKILLFIGVICNVIAQFFLKFAMKKTNIVLFKQNLFLEIIHLIFNPYIILSILFYGSGFFIYAIALTKIELSKAYPISSVAAIVLIFIISVLFLSESYSLVKIIGLLFCIIGIFLIFK